MFGPSKPGDAPGQKGQTQALSSVNLNGSLSADVPSIRLLIAAMNAATASGATQVNANSGKGGVPFGTVQPSASDLAKATQGAVANARTNAEALAAASGRKVGAIRSISSSQLPMMGCCPPNSGWTVQVTVTFDFAPWAPTGLHKYTARRIICGDAGEGGDRRRDGVRGRRARASAAAPSGGPARRRGRARTPGRAATGSAAASPRRAGVPRRRPGSGRR